MAIRIVDVELVSTVEEKIVATTRCVSTPWPTVKACGYEDRDNRQLRERTLVTPAITVVARIHPASCAIQMIHCLVTSAGYGAA